MAMPKVITSNIHMTTQHEKDNFIDHKSILMTCFFIIVTIIEIVDIKIIILLKIHLSKIQSNR